MSHDPEAEEALVEAMQTAWNEWCDDTGCFPDCLTWHGGNGKLSANFRRGNFITHVIDYLAAAGYTVTKGRYEHPTKPGMGDERLAAGYVQPDYAGWFAESAIGENGIEPLYRRIEGSTDGADRD